MPMPKVVGPFWSNPSFHRRFFSRLKPNGECLEWQGAIGSTGYGQIGYGEKDRISTHVAAWSIAHQAPVPPGIDVCHTCDNRRCCRDDHLFVGTRLVNMADARAKGRTLAGEANKSAKLTCAQVLDIFERYHAGERSAAIAREYGISASYPGQIARGEVWGWLTGVKGMAA